MLFFNARQKVGCLGKVPLGADFNLESRIGGGAEDALAAWLHSIPKPEPNGMGEVGSPSVPAVDGGHGFFLFGSGRRAAISGRLWPSRDSAGRQFPFAIYIALDRKAMKSDLFTLLGKLRSPWEELGALASSRGHPWVEMDDASPADAASASRALREAKINLGDPAEGRGDPSFQAGEFHLWPFLEALFPGDSRVRAAGAFLRFGRFLKNFVGITRPDMTRPAVALRAPFSASHPAWIQVAFWAGWMESALGKPVPLPEALFVPRDGEESPGGLWFVYRSLLPQDGEVLFYGRKSHEYLFDLVSTGEPGDAEPELAGKLGDLKTAKDLFGLEISG